MILYHNYSYVFFRAALFRNMSFRFSYPDTFFFPANHSKGSEEDASWLAVCSSPLHVFALLWYPAPRFCFGIFRTVGSHQHAKVNIWAKREGGHSKTFWGQNYDKESHNFAVAMATGGPSPPAIISGLMKGTGCVDVVVLVVSAPQTPPQDGHSPTRLWTISGIFFVTIRNIWSLNTLFYQLIFHDCQTAENCNILYKFGKNSWFVGRLFCVCS